MRNRTPTVAIVRVPDWPDAWQRYRFQGEYLIAPGGERITPHRLEGLLWRQASEQRLAQVRARKRRRVSDSVVTVLRVRNCDWHRERFGVAAG